jgi:hypothetical protein
MATSANPVGAERLGEVSRDLEALPQAMINILFRRPVFTIVGRSPQPNGCRSIAMVPIDINTKFSDYWLWTEKKTGQYHWINRILEIVNIFERPRIHPGRVLIKSRTVTAT